MTEFVQPQHLEPAAMSARREAFESHPARLTVINDFLLEHVAAQVAEFLAGDAVFGRDYGLYSAKDGKFGRVKADAWDQAADDNRFYRYGAMVGIAPEAGLADSTLAYLQLQTSLRSAEFADFLYEITGSRVAAGDDFTAHRMEAGDFLREHNDSRGSRRLALVVYLTPDWRSDYGGSLEVTGHDGDRHTVEATYNSAVIFDTQGHEVHHVAPVTPAAGELARLTIGGWYHDPVGVAATA
jgi:hypothetical protein